MPRNVVDTALWKSFFQFFLSCSFSLSLSSPLPSSSYFFLSSVSVLPSLGSFILTQASFMVLPWKVLSPFYKKMHQGLLANCLSLAFSLSYLSLLEGSWVCLRERERNKDFKFYILWISVCKKTIQWTGTSALNLFIRSCIDTSSPIFS